MNLRDKLEALGGVKPNVTINNKKGSTNNTLEDLSKVQFLFEKEIPHLYIEFIRMYGSISFNNFVCVKGIESIPVASKDNKVVIDNFFGFSNNEASSLKILKTFKGNIPDYILPICEGEAGNLIAIDMSEANYGKIYYWLHEEEQPFSLYLIANNFNDFISKLEIKEEEKEENSKSDVTASKVSNKFLERLKKSGKL